jgi:hypothetical protein
MTDFTNDFGVDFGAVVPTIPVGGPQAAGGIATFALKKAGLWSTATGQTAAATTCTFTWGTAYGSRVDCVAMGQSSPLTGAATPSTGSLVVNFASTANYKFSYLCPGM